MTPTPEWTAADEDDDARARSTFDRADNTARLALEVAELKRERISLEAALDRASRDTVGEARAYRTLLARAEAAEAEVRDLRTKVAAVEALHSGTHWCFDADGQDVVFERGTQWWPCSTLAALASLGRTEPEPEVCQFCGDAALGVADGPSGATYPSCLMPGCGFNQRKPGRTEPEGAGETFTVAQIREAYEKHAGKDDWGVPSFYEKGLVAALRGEYDATPAPEGAGAAECGSEHPTNPSVVPCVRDVGHEGSHMSTTGCGGSVMHWTAAPAPEAGGEGS